MMPDQSFKNLFDEMILIYGHDAELREGLQWIEQQARSNGVSVYEIAYAVWQRHQADKHAKAWLKSKMQ